MRNAEVTRTTKNGLYGQLVSLSYGENEFVFTQGDESITITYRYAHLYPSKQEEMARRLNLEREKTSGA